MSKYSRIKTSSLITGFRIGLLPIMLATAIFSAASMCFSSPIAAKDDAPSTLKGVKANAARTIGWEDLMPAEDMELLETMAPIDHEALSKEELAKDKIAQKNSLIAPGSISRFETASGAAEKPKKRTWRDALVSTITRPEFNNQKIKIAGYIVPLEYNRQHQLTDFFLVPYFGACTHVPPPPPNQIIYVRIPKGLPLQEIYAPFWVEGTLKIESTKKDLGLSSYSLDADSVAVYKEE